MEPPLRYTGGDLGTCEVCEARPATRRAPGGSARVCQACAAQSPPQHRLCSFGSERGPIDVKKSSRDERGGRDPWRK
jgi:hypothetical protein